MNETMTCPTCGGRMSAGAPKRKQTGGAPASVWALLDDTPSAPPGAPGGRSEIDLAWCEQCGFLEAHGPARKLEIKLAVRRHP